MTQHLWIVLALALTGVCCPHGVAQDKPVLFADKSPGEIYRLIHQARWSMDAATVLACTSRRVSVTPEQAYNDIMLGRATRPQVVKVTTENVEAGMATVRLAGQRQDRESGKMLRTQGTATFLQEDGTWRLRHVEWTPEIQEPAPPPGRPSF